MVLLGCLLIQTEFRAEFVKLLLLSGFQPVSFLLHFFTPFLLFERGEGTFGALSLSPLLLPRCSPEALHSHPHPSIA